MKDFDIKFKTFFAGVKELKARGITASYSTVDYKMGRRYIKIVNVDFGEVRSVWGFVDRTNGNVLKAAGWAAPAKHARGNIFDDANGLATVSEYGPAYLKG